MPRQLMRILIVEDFPAIAAAMKVFVRTLGHEAMAVGTAAEALELLERYQFALLISDIGLPGCDGWELLRQVRQRWPVRAIAVSARVEPEDREKSRTAGFEAHLAKPVDLNQLAQWVARVSE